MAASRPARRKRPTSQTIDLALQGGGSHGAFTWGVLDRLLEDTTLAIHGVSGTSAGALNAAVLATGWGWLDPVIAIAVALNILRVGAALVWQSVRGLMDEALEPEVMATIQQTLDGFASAEGEASIIRFDHVSTRKAGQRRFVDLHMHMPASWSLGRAAAVRASVEQALMSAVPGLRATIQLLPSDVEAHFDDEKDLI